MESLPLGSPILKSPAIAGICPLPTLIAAYHVLLRLREPQASPMRPYLLSFYLFAFLFRSITRVTFVFKYHLRVFIDLLVHHVNDLSKVVPGRVELPTSTLSV